MSKMRCVFCIKANFFSFKLSTANKKKNKLKKWECLTKHFKNFIYLWFWLNKLLKQYFYTKNFAKLNIFFILKSWKIEKYKNN